MADNSVRITVTASGAAEAARVLNAVAKEGAQLGSVTAAGAAQARKELDGLGASARKVFEIFTGVSLGNIFAQAIASARAFSVELVKLGLEAKQQEDAFARLTASIGVSGDALLAKLHEVSGGIIDTSDVMRAASTALLEGLQPQQLVTLMEIARQQAKLTGQTVAETFNAMAEAIGNQREKGLQSIRINIDAAAALEDYAKTLGTTADHLNEAQKTQAFYNAVVEKTRPVVAALSQEARTHSEWVEKMSAAWSGVKTEIAKALVDAGFAILAWLQDVRKEVGDLGPSLTQLGTVWTATWTNAKAAFEPIVSMIGGFKPLVDGILDAIATVGVGANLVFTQMVGPITLVSRLLDDLANKRLPDMAAHGAAVGKAMADANQRFDASVLALQRMRAAAQTGSDSVSVLGVGVVKVAAAAGLGTNRLGALGNQVKVTAADMKAAAAEAEKLADAIRKGHVEAAEAKLAETEAELKMNLEITNKLLAEEKRLLDLDTAGWVAYADAKFEKTETELNDELRITNERLAAEKKALDDVNAGWVAHAEAVLEGTEASLKATERANAPLRAYHDTLESINLQARLFGPSFDAVSPTIAAVTAEILRLGAAGQDVTALQEKLAGLKQVQDLKGIFQDVFGSIGSAINTLVQGVILGTQTMAQAWDKLWKSILLSFINSGIQKLLGGLQNQLWNFISGLFTASGGASSLAAGGAGGGGGGSAAAGGGWNTGTGSGGGGGTGGWFGNIPSGVFDPGMWSSMAGVAQGLWGAVGGVGGTLGPAFTGVGAADVALAGGSLTEIGGALTAATGAASAFTVGLAGVGAAVAVFGTIMDFTSGKTEAAIGGLVGGVALGAVGAYFAGPAGALIGYALGDFLGSWIGGMFGGPSNFELKRIAAADEAGRSLGNVAGGYQAALNTGDLAQILAALSRGAGGSGNSVRSELVLPTGLAAQIGITGQQIGDQLVAQWSSLTLEQFEQVIAAFREQPALIENIRGSGDVPYLSPGEAQAIADQIAGGAEALLSAFIAMTKVRDRITQLAVDLGEVGAEILPPGLADTFAHGIVDPIRDRMLAVLSSGLPIAEMQKQLDALAEELQNYVGLVALYGQVEQDIAKLSGDIATQTEGAIIGIKGMMRAADRAVEDARSRAVEAITPGEVLAAQAQLRDAILGRYQMEMNLVQQIQAQIAALLEIQAKVQGTLTRLAVEDLEAGDATAITEIISALADMAAHAPTVAQRLSAVGAGLAAVLQALPVRVQAMFDVLKNATGMRPGAGGLVGRPDYEPGGPGRRGGETVSDAIVRQLYADAAPFFDALATLIHEAGAAGDLQGQLSLLQQQAELISQVGAAAESAVQQWAEAAIAATNKALDAQVEAINTAADAQVEAINTAADARDAAIAKEADAMTALLTAQIAVAGVIDRIRLSTMSTAERLTVMTARWEAAQAAFGGAGMVGLPDAEVGPGPGLSGRPDYEPGPGGLVGLPDFEPGPGSSMQVITPEMIDELRHSAEEYLAAAQAQIRAVADEQIKGVEAVRDKQIEALQGQIAGIEAARDARVEQLNAELAAVEESARVAAEWQRVVEEIGDYLTGLRLSPQAPINPADQLKLAQANFAAAQAAFNKAPSVQGAADVQQAAQDLLTAGQGVFTKPSPEYQALFASVVQAMEAVQATAAGKAGPTTAEALQKQAELIREQIEQTHRDAEAQIAGVNELIALAQSTAQKQIDAINAKAKLDAEALAKHVANVLEKLAKIEKTGDPVTTLTHQLNWWKNWRIEQLEDSAEDRRLALEAVAEQRRFEIAQIEKMREAQIAAIKATAQTTIDNIRKGTRDALRENAEEQNRILGLLVGAQLDQLNAITGGQPIQHYMAEQAKLTAGYLREIRDDLARFLAGVPGNAAGDWRSSGGLRILHPGEMVIPNTPAELLRRGGALTAARPASRSGGIQITFAPVITVTGGDPALIKAVVDEALRKARRDMMRELESGAAGRRLTESVT